MLRGVAQMVARMVRDHEVVGSNPVTPTIQIDTNLDEMSRFVFYFKISPMRP